MQRQRTFFKAQKETFLRNLLPASAVSSQVSGSQLFVVLSELWLSTLSQRSRNRKVLSQLILTISSRILVWFHLAKKGLEDAVEDSITESVQPFCDPFQYIVLPPGISSGSFGFNLLPSLCQTVGNLGNYISLKKKSMLKVDVEACMTSPSNICHFQPESARKFFS